MQNWGINLIIHEQNTKEITAVKGSLYVIRPVNSKLDWNDILAAIFEAK